MRSRVSRSQDARQGSVTGEVCGQVFVIGCGCMGCSTSQSDSDDIGDNDRLIGQLLPSTLLAQARFVEKARDRSATLQTRAVGACATQL